MRGSLIGHACWFAVAVAAFTAGYLVHDDTSSVDDVEKRHDGNSERRKTSSNSFSTLDANDAGAANREGESASNRRLKSPESGLSKIGMAFELPRKGPLNERQLDELAHKALKDPNPVVRRFAFSKLLEALTVENAQSIRKHLLGMRGDSSQWRDFHYAWGAIDGEAAIANAMKSNETDLAVTMSGWAAADPSAAIDWLASGVGGPRADGNRGMLTRSLVSGLADRDPAMATDYVFGLAASGDRSAADLLGVVASEVLRGAGPVEASRWAGSLPDGPMKGSAMDRVAHEYVAADPQAAASWAAQFANESYAARVIEEVGDEWAKRDPAASVGWLESLPAGGGQSEGLNSAYSQWARRDAAAASQRLFDMASSPARDSAVSGFVQGFSNQDPRAAITWAESISAEPARVESLTRAGQALFRQNADEARNWVATSGLPAQAQQAVLNPPRGR